MKKLLILLAVGLIFLTPLLRSKDERKVYDCFMFLNELEILEIRLNELYKHVDKFVLVESTRTHRKGETKPLYFEENKKRFDKFSDKIIHIVLDQEIKTDNPWLRENWERNQIMRGLKGCHDNDLIIISDVDEIIPGSVINKLKKSIDKEKVIGFSQKMYRWFFNRYTKCLWAGTAATTFKNLKLYSPQSIRELVREERVAIWRYGWHFTSMGGYEKNKDKYKSIVEGSDVFLPYEIWRAQVEGTRLVSINKRFPKYIKKNKKYFKKIGFIDE
ncbi:MAG: hypothetical protein COT84_00195 [Chlamydiae bacterium CG10_big_fil_rev_8_21_14_0_10_35_9]|nr:MAG: hypothetical protein COT84_00195 [Chlamydiae bacterium CG10_big_fil_rev_8_21_14_0_10_35_9]